MENLKFLTIVAHAPENSSNFIWSGSPINWITSSAIACCCFYFFICLAFSMSIVVFEQYPFNIFLFVYGRSSIFCTNLRETALFGKSEVWTLYRTPLSLSTCPSFHPFWICMFSFNLPFDFRIFETQSFLITKSNTTHRKLYRYCWFIHVYSFVSFLLFLIS